MMAAMEEEMMEGMEEVTMAVEMVVEMVVETTAEMADKMMATVMEVILETTVMRVMVMAKLFHLCHLQNRLLLHPNRHPRLRHRLLLRPAPLSF